MQMHGRELWILVASLAQTIGCSTIERDYRSGYIDDPTASTEAQIFYTEKRQLREEHAREELGWSSDRPLSESEMGELETRLKLHRLESRLKSDREKRQYFQLKGAFRDDDERIYFLRLPTIEARERWAIHRGLVGINEKHSDEVAGLIEKNDIMLGMTEKAVLESWGDPDAVETAGNSIYENQRWLYSRYDSSSEGYQKKTRIVYFEAGRVSGWETQ